MHLVNTLKLEATCGSEDSAFGLQHHIAPKVQELVAAAIEKAAAAMNDPSAMVIIDRIEIDLGILPMHFSEEALASLIEFEVMRQVQPHIPVTNTSSTPLPEQNNKELFRQFMLTGTLPWWAQNMQPDISSLFSELADNHQSWVTGFLYEHRSSSRFWQRMVYQLKPFAKRKLVERADELHRAAGILKELMSRIQYKPVYGITAEPPLPVGMETLQEIEITDPHSAGVLTEEEFWNLLLTGAPLLYRATGSTETQQALFRILMNNQNNPAIIPLLKGAAEWAAGASFNTAAANTATGNTATANRSETAAIGDHQHTNRNGDEEEGHKDEKYFVEHSGLVILSPFLKIFFNGLKLLEEGQWKSPEHCFKAVHLLKYMATGITEIAEYALTFEKILCGLSPDIPVPLDAGLQTEEINEADTLLKDLIGHWKALKNTSVNGLRETFLKRDGIITRKEDGWHLKTERKTADVLLDMMPWGFSVIRFPWAPVPVFTEW